MRIRVCAVAVESNSILTIRFTYSGKAVFALPGSGVQRGEPILETLARAWKSELGLHIEPGELLLVGDAPGDKRHPRTLHLVFEAGTVSGKPRIIRGNSGGDEVEWIPLDNLNTVPLYPDIGPRLLDILRGSKGTSFMPNCMERGFW